MRWLSVLFLSLVVCSTYAQKISDGLWNAGRVFNATPAKYGDSLILQKLVVRVQLYPGFSVVRTDLDLVNPGKDSLLTPLAWKDSSSTPHPYFNQIGGLPPAARVLIVNNDTVATDHPILFTPGITSISVFEITPNQQALLARSGTVREGNAFVYTITKAARKISGQPQVFVQMSGDLTLTNVMGIYPDSAVTTTMSQVKWLPDLQKLEKEQSLVIWYEGAAADMKLEKKVLPASQQLYRELNGLNLSLFDTPSFSKSGKKDFSTNKRSPFFSFLYFLMFSTPWILLLAFLGWLIFKPKKKKES